MIDTTVYLTGAPLAILIIAALCTAPIAFTLIASYRRTVIRLMSKRAQPASVNTTALEQPISSLLPAVTKPQFVYFNSALVPQDPASMSAYDSLRLRRWQAAAIYVLGGLCFASFMAVSFLLASEIALSRMRLAVFIWAFFWPAVLIVNLVAASNRRTGLAIVLAYFMIGAILGSLGFETNPFKQIAAIWANDNLPPTILVFLFLYRRVRAVGPMVFTFMDFGLVGIALAIYAANVWITQAINKGGLARTLIDPFLHLPTIVFPFLVVGIGFLTIGLFGWSFLQFLKWLYLHHRLNDQSMILDPIWLIFSFFNSIGLVFESPWWILSGLAAFAIYKIVTWSGFAWLNRKHKQRPGLKLLILRVFSLGARSEKLYGAIAKAWRYIGNIRFITGPDLAAATVEPHNFLDYLSGKLPLRFIDSFETLEQRLATADVLPTLDGRYRIHDFFCHEDTWKMVLSRLAIDSDVILMDLRKFSPTNAGCIFEINELLNYVPLKRVLFVIDKTTDEGFLKATIDKAWVQMRSESPNRNDGSTIQLFHYFDSRPGDYNRLLYALSVAATPN